MRFLHSSSRSIGQPPMPCPRSTTVRLHQCRSNRVRGFPFTQGDVTLVQVQAQDPPAHTGPSKCVLSNTGGTAKAACWPARTIYGLRVEGRSCLCLMCHEGPSRSFGGTTLPTSTASSGPTLMPRHALRKSVALLCRGTSPVLIFHLVGAFWN